MYIHKMKKELDKNRYYGAAGELRNPDRPNLVSAGLCQGIGLGKKKHILLYCITSRKVF